MTSHTPLPTKHTPKNKQSTRAPRHKSTSHETKTLVETAGTFYMLQACMQGNFQKNLENSDCAQEKFLYNFHLFWKIFDVLAAH